MLSSTYISLKICAFQAMKPVKVKMNTCMRSGVAGGTQNACRACEAANPGLKNAFFELAGPGNQKSDNKYFLLGQLEPSKVTAAATWKRREGKDKFARACQTGSGGGLHNIPDTYPRTCTEKTIIEKFTVMPTGVPTADLATGGDDTGTDGCNGDDDE